MVIICEICYVGVAVSYCSQPFGPVSLACCERCLKEDAWPLWAFIFILELIDGDETAIGPHIKKCKSFDNGKYLDWPGIMEAYRRGREDYL